MSTTTVPLAPSPFDPVGTAELERLMLGLTADEFSAFHTEVADALRATAPEHRHTLVVIERVDQRDLVDQLRWTDDGRLEARERRTLTIGCRL